VGRPAEVEETERRYWLGNAFEKLDRHEEAVTHWMLGSYGEGGSETEQEYRKKCHQAVEQSGDD